MCKLHVYIQLPCMYDFHVCTTLTCVQSPDAILSRGRQRSSKFLVFLFHCSRRFCSIWQIHYCRIHLMPIEMRRDLSFVFLVLCSAFILFMSRSRSAIVKHWNEGVLNYTDAIEYCTVLLGKVSLGSSSAEIQLRLRWRFNLSGTPGSGPGWISGWTSALRSMNHLTDSRPASASSVISNNIIDYLGMEHLFLWVVMVNYVSSITASRIKWTPKNTVISPNFLMGKFWGKA